MSEDDPFADLNPLNSQIPVFTILPTNDGYIKVEIVTSSSQVSPIEQSESINWNQWMNHRFDWAKNIGQRVILQQVLNMTIPPIFPCKTISNLVSIVAVAVVEPSQMQDGYSCFGVARVM